MRFDELSWAVKKAICSERKKEEWEVQSMWKYLKQQTFYIHTTTSRRAMTMDEGDDDDVDGDRMSVNE
jgi:hypothetical protein